MYKVNNVATRAAWGPCCYAKIAGFRDELIGMSGQYLLMAAFAWRGAGSQQLYSKHDIQCNHELLFP